MLLLQLLSEFSLIWNFNLILLHRFFNSQQYTSVYISNYLTDDKWAIILIHTPVNKVRFLWERSISKICFVTLKRVFFVLQVTSLFDTHSMKPAWIFYVAERRIICLKNFSQPFNKENCLELFYLFLFFCYLLTLLYIHFKIILFRWR